MCIINAVHPILENDAAEEEERKWWTVSDRKQFAFQKTMLTATHSIEDEGSYGDGGGGTSVDDEAPAAAAVTEGGVVSSAMAFLSNPSADEVRSARQRKSLRVFDRNDTKYLTEIDDRLRCINT